MAGVHYDQLHQLLDDYVQGRVVELDISKLEESLRSMTPEQRWKLFISARTGVPSYAAIGYKTVVAAIDRNHVRVIKFFLELLSSTQKSELLKENVDYNGALHMVYGRISMVHYVAL